jgi:hypothetical protein
MISGESEDRCMGLKVAWIVQLFGFQLELGNNTTSHGLYTWTHGLYAIKLGSSGSRHHWDARNLADSLAKSGVSMARSLAARSELME